MKVIFVSILDNNYVVYILLPIRNLCYENNSQVYVATLYATLNCRQVMHEPIDFTFS